MGFNTENNAWGKLKVSCSSSDTDIILEDIGLLPTKFPFKARVKTLDGSNNIKQQEVINVTGISGTTLIVERAVEQCPKDSISIVHTQTAWNFEIGDIVEVILTAEMGRLIALDNEVVHLEGDEIINGNKSFNESVSAPEFIGDGSKLTGLSAEVSSASLNILMGVDGLTAGKAYSQVNYEQLTGGTDNSFGQDDQPEISQSIYGYNEITSVVFNLKQVGGDRNDVYVELQGDNSGIPDGNVLATSNVVSKDDIADTYSEITFTINYTPDDGKLYHFVLKATGTDINDYFQAESAGADSQIGTMSTNDGTVWENQTDDLYFKIPGYYLAIIGGTNFVGILDVAKNIGEIGKFNTQYSDKLNGLTPKSYYGYDEANGDIIPGNLFYAISDSGLDLIRKTGVFGNGIDGDLILDGTNNQLNPNQVYNFNNLTIPSGETLTLNGQGNLYLHIAGTLDLSGDIDVSGMGELGTITSNVELLNLSITSGIGGNGGNGGDGGTTDDGENHGGYGGIGYSCGGGGGGGSSQDYDNDDDYQNGGDGGDGGNPGGVGGSGGAGGGDAYGYNGDDYNGDGVYDGGAGGLSAGGGGSSSRDNGYGGGGGGAGGVGGANGSNIVIIVNNLIGNGNFILNGSNGTDGGDGGDGKKTGETSDNNVGGTGGGGGGGGGGAGGSVLIIYNTNTKEYTFVSNGGSGGNKGLTGSSGYRLGFDGVDGTAGTGGEIIEKQLYTLL